MRAAKILAGLGALALLLSGGCFLLLDNALSDLSGGPESPPWVIGLALLVAGVLCVVAFLGLREE